LKNQSLTDNLHLHFIVVILAFTAILGKLISLPAMELTIIRMTIAFFGLYLFMQFKTKTKHNYNFKQYLIFIATGFVVALHWFTFYEAIKIANVSVALACFSSTTLFTAFLEPLFLKRKIYFLEIIIGIIIIAGLSIIFKFEFEYITGIIVGIISAFLASLFSVFNQLLAQKYDHLVVSKFELIGGAIFLFFIYLIKENNIAALFAFNGLDLLYLTILALVCTTYAFTAVLELQKRLSAFQITLFINLEPVYGIILAFLIFGESEKMSLQFYIAATVVFVAVFSYPIIKKKYISIE